MPSETHVVDPRLFQPRRTTRPSGLVITHVHILCPAVHVRDGFACLPLEICTVLRQRFTWHMDLARTVSQCMTLWTPLGTHAPADHSVISLNSPGRWLRNWHLACVSMQATIVRPRFCEQPFGCKPNHRLRSIDKNTHLYCGCSGLGAVHCLSSSQQNPFNQIPSQIPCTAILLKHIQQNPLALSNICSIHHPDHSQCHFQVACWYCR